jgi:glutamyl-tRNA reductase
VEPSLIVIGVNFKTAPTSVCDRFSIAEGRRYDALHSLVRSEGIDEAIVLNTSERTEFVVWASDASLAANSVLRFLTREFDLKLCEWSSFYRLIDEDALLHVFRMIAGVAGDATREPGLPDKIKLAWQKAQLAGTTGRFLDAVMQQAFEVADRIRIETITDADTEHILYEEAASFRKKLLAEQVVPTIVALRNRLDEICRQELSNLGEEFGPFTEDQRQALNKLAAHITQRIAGSLARELKDMPERAEQETLTAAVQRLFHLEMQTIGVTAGKH